MHTVKLKHHLHAATKREITVFIKTPHFLSNLLNMICIIFQNMLNEFSIHYS